MVTKSAPATIVSGKDLEKDATALDLDILHKDFFVPPKTPSADSNCNSLSKHKSDVKDLCNKTVHFLKEIAKSKVGERDQRCNYLPYWLYDEIAKIHEKHQDKISSITFIKELTDAVNKANKGITVNKCNASLYYHSITLDDWKKRKISYIYFNKHDDIKTKVNSKIKDQCSKYLKYLNIYAPLYKKYYVDNCNGWFFNGSTYFKCDGKYDPNILLTTAQKCSTGSTGSGGTLLSIFGLGSSPSRTSQSSASGTRQGASSSLGSAAASPLSSQSRGAPQLAGRSATSQPPTHLNGIKIEDPEVQKALEKAMAAQSGGMGLQGQIAQMTMDGSYVAGANSPEGSTSSVDFLKKTQEFLKSDNFRHSVVGASAIGVSRSGSRSNKKKKSRRKPEYNYYDPNEEVLSMYGYEHSVADSQMDDVNLSYQPRRRDSYY
ncbi:PIR protein [Plasmodium vivax]|uniref:VIR protein n=1 Tax=Plasmodium vivax TaxID=5855 RepID=A0A565A653_PLAVI|nr:PIR protein [Plasmodium vivax]